MDLDKEEIAEIVQGFEKDIQDEKTYLSDAMNPSLDDDERESCLEDAYLCHLKVNRESILVGKKVFDKYLKDVVQKEYEEIEVLNFEDYLNGKELMETTTEHPEDYATD